MKTAEPKSHTTAARQTEQQSARSPFLSRDGGQGEYWGQQTSHHPFHATENVTLRKPDHPFGRRTPFFSPTTIQPKLTIGQPGDKYEREADATAERVVEQINDPAAGKGPAIQTQTEEEKIQEKPIFESEAENAGPEIQAKCAKCEQEENAGIRTQIQQEESTAGNDSAVFGSTGTQADQVVPFENDLQTSKGQGRPLPMQTKTPMESAFGADFSGVRVHTGDRAAQMNEKLHAQAFTHGSDIYFNSGKYDPASEDGQKLLAHELTHTVQQGQSKPTDDGAPTKDSTIPSEPGNAATQEERAEGAEVAQERPQGNKSAAHAASGPRGPEGAAKQHETYTDQAVQPPISLASETVNEAPEPVESQAAGAEAIAERIKSIGGDSGTGGEIPCISKAEKGPENSHSISDLDYSSPYALQSSLYQLPPYDLAEALNGLPAGYSETSRTFEEDITAGLPIIQQPTGLPTGLRPPLIDPEQEEELQAPEMISFGLSQQEKLEETHTQPDEPAVRQSTLPGEVNKDNYGALINQLPQSDPYLNRQIGAEAKVPLTGDADPQQSALNKMTSDQSVDAGRNSLLTYFRQDFGESEIRPTVEKEELSAQYDFESGEGIEIDQQNLVPLDEEYRQALNADLEKQMVDERAQHLENTSKANDAFYLKREEIIEGGLGSIREEESNIGRKQQEDIDSNKAAIREYRQQLSDETTAVAQEYLARADAENSQLNEEVAETVSDAELQGDLMLTDAEKQAERRENEARARVEERRKKAREKESEKSWFDIAVEAVGDFFASLKAEIEGIFNDLRSWVKNFFETIKRKVNDLIENARKWVVDRIRAFGNFLKNLVSVALARFPVLRDKFNHLIDRAIEKTVNLVNEAAERLKRFAQQVLDGIAWLIDQHLQLLEQAIQLSLSFLQLYVELTIRTFEYFFDMLVNQLLVATTLLAFSLLIAGGFFVAIAWQFLGDNAKEKLIDFALDLAIKLFEAAPDDMRFGVLWPLFVHMNLGFLYEAQASCMEDKKAVMDKIARIITGMDPEFTINFFINIFVGIWDNIWGILEGIWMIIRFIFYDLWVILAKVVETIVEIAPDIAEMITNLNEDIHEFIQAFREEGIAKIKKMAEGMSLEKIKEFLEGLGDDLRVKAEVVGAELADSARTFMLSKDSSAKIGEKLGRITGYLLVEIVLALPYGIGTAIKWGIKGATVVIKFLRLFRGGAKVADALITVARFLRMGVKWLIKAILRAADELAKLAAKVMQKFRKLFANIQKKIDDIIAKITGKKPNRFDGDVYDTKHIKEKDWKNRKPKNDKVLDYPFAVAEAKAIIAANELLGVNPYLVEGELDLYLKKKYRWIESFEAEPDGLDNYDFYLIASKKKVYDNFKNLKKQKARIEKELGEILEGGGVQFLETKDGRRFVGLDDKTWKKFVEYVKNNRTILDDLKKHKLGDIEEYIWRIESHHTIPKWMGGPKNPMRYFDLKGSLHRFPVGSIHQKINTFWSKNPLLNSVSPQAGIREIRSLAKQLGPNRFKKEVRDVLEKAYKEVLGEGDEFKHAMELVDESLGSVLKK